ncbi:hypothetical protein B0I35DRAFT_472524 [Stachybotrys elegans]|uniref:CFEM domain-containing protein n=1 Tax=Stachybotrys elegans TaxID=80388 RepID=A0A8K0SZG5_9HYPO|nr:hypothetical protein B0I35DRAFT_472524 [Stachybotrys elegans]
MLPACAASCILGALSESVCSLTDVDCLCNNKDFLKASEDCVLGGCTREQAYSMLNGTSYVCNFPRRDRSQTVHSIAITFTTLASVVAATRVVYQTTKRGGTGIFWDDGLVLVALALVIAEAVILVAYAIPDGLGKDVWMVTYPEIVRFVHWLYLVEVIYFAAVPILKASFLVFFYRIFGQSSIQYAIIGTMIVNGLYGVIFFFVAVFQCNPIIFTWKDLDHQTGCMDVNAILWAHAAINIAVDIWMLALPMSRLRSLQMHWKKKLAVGTMLGTGAMITVFTIIRLNSLLKFSKATNPTWEQYGVALWTIVELNVGIICACMPSMANMMKHFVPNLLSSSSKYSTGKRRYYIRSGPKDENNSGSKSTVQSLGTGICSLPKVASGAILQTQTFEIESDDEERLFPGRQRDKASELYALGHLGPTGSICSTP